MNNVLETIKARRSVRAYDNRPVPLGDLLAILEAATYAPSGMHYETWHLGVWLRGIGLRRTRRTAEGEGGKGRNRHDCGGVGPVAATSRQPSQPLRKEKQRMEKHSSNAFHTLFC